MKRTWRIRLAALLCALAVGNGAAAEEKLLAVAELEHAHGAEPLKIELWGDMLEGGYAQELLLLAKDKNEKIVTAYAPSVKGGYNPFLQAVKIKPVGKENTKQPEQLLLSIGMGDWTAPTEYRVLDFAKPGKVQELFSAADSMGLVTRAYVNEESLYVDLNDGSQNTAKLPADLAAEAVGPLDYGGLSGLSAYDIDKDGQQELFATQQINVRRQLLADVGAVWKLLPDEDASDAKPLKEEKADEGKVEKVDLTSAKYHKSAYTIMTGTLTPRENTVNDGCDFGGGAVLPRKIVVPGGEATYPVIAMKDVQLQNKANGFLQKESKAYLDSFFKGEADMAFKVLRSDELLLSLQLISGKTSFRHHHVHLDPKTGEPVSLEQILNTKDPDLLPLLRLLNNNKNVILERRLPAEWYIEGDKLFLVQNICGKDEAAGYALGNLHKFLLDKKWLPEMK